MVGRVLLKKWVWVLMPVSFELVDPISGHDNFWDQA